MTTIDTTSLRATLGSFAEFLGPTGALYRFVLDHGREYEPTPWKTWRGRGYQVGRLRECFKNAELLVRLNPDLTYVEGFATSRASLPIPHAWATDGERVVDPTWRDRSTILGPVSERDYFGIPFDLDWLTNWTETTGTYGVFGDRLDLSAIADGIIQTEGTP